MLEIGKRDFIGRAQLGMDAFEANRAFCGIDMSQMAVERPKICKRYVLPQPSTIVNRTLTYRSVFYSSVSTTCRRVALNPSSPSRASRPLT